MEKDYWIMHCLHGIGRLGLKHELKGGTSLSKGYGIIQRFSEDIDIRIEPPAHHVVKTGKNHSKPAHIQSRKDYFDWLSNQFAIDGVVDVVRDEEFDDRKQFRNAGIRLLYPSLFDPVPGLKEGILLEVGFDDTTPNQRVMISSWAYDHACGVSLPLIDNRAAIECYNPEYTFVEKLQTVSTKFRQQQQAGNFSRNFLRHYYDIYCLLGYPSVQHFIGTPAYEERKLQRFRQGDEVVIAKNEAFLLSDPAVRALYEAEYGKTAGLYYAGQVPFEKILECINKNIDRL